MEILIALRYGLLALEGVFALRLLRRIFAQLLLQEE